MTIWHKNNILYSNYAQPVSYTHLGCMQQPGRTIRQLGKGRKGKAAKQNDKEQLKPVSYTHLDVYKRQGISAPFEEPAHPALTLDTSVLSLEESVNKLLELILPRIQKK